MLALLAWLTIAAIVAELGVRSNNVWLIGTAGIMTLLLSAITTF